MDAGTDLQGRTQPHGMTGKRRHRKRTENECCILETNHFENEALGKTSRKKVALGLKYVNPDLLGFKVASGSSILKQQNL